jgi:hypothetical protein
MQQTGDAWNPRLQARQPRAMIQMPPPTNWDVIVQRQNDTAFGAPKTSIPSVAQKDVDTLGLRMQTNGLDHPGPRQREQLHEDIDVAHGAKPPLL